MTNRVLIVVLFLSLAILGLSEAKKTKGEFTMLCFLFDFVVLLTTVRRLFCLFLRLFAYILHGR